MVASVLWWPTVADAQTSCSGVAVGAQVTIESPTGGRVPSTFSVRGRVTSTLPVSSVYLLIDGSVVSTRNYSPSANLAYEFSVGPSVAAPGSRSIQVIACGSGLSLVRGQSGVVTVEVQRPAVTTTAPMAAAPVPAAPPTSAGSAPATTVGPASGGARPPGPTSTTSRARTADRAESAAAPPEAPGPLPAEDDPLEATDRGPAGDGPVTLSDEASDGSDSPPLWVGLVVGLSGVAGLTLSGLVRRRAASSPPLVVDRPDHRPEDKPSLGVGAR